MCNLHSLQWSGEGTGFGSEHLHLSPGSGHYSLCDPGKLGLSSLDLLASQANRESQMPTSQLVMRINYTNVYGSISSAG